MTHEHYIIFNGKSSLDFGLYAGSQESFVSTKRDVTRVSIPGRNGDLILDNGKYVNRSIPYWIVAVDQYSLKVDDINAWLTEPVTYARLEDGFHPDMYRMGFVSESITHEMFMLNKSGRAKIWFNCKPQWFLKSGDKAQAFTENGAVINPTKFDSLPLIRVYGSGSGTVTIGNKIITISNIGTYVDIDSDLQDCYHGTENRNNTVSLGTKFPILPSGKTGIEFSGGVTKVEIQGRWWTI